MRCLSSRSYGIWRFAMESPDDTTRAGRRCMAKKKPMRSGLGSHALDQPAGLAVPAKVGDALVGSNQRDRSAATRARFAGLHVHRHELARLQMDLLAHQDAQAVDGIQERGAHALVEAQGLLIGQLGALAE